MKNDDWRILLHREAYVLKAIQLSSYQEAAAALYVAPQTISKAVSEEEKRFGKKIFRQKGRGVEPTEFGRYYAEIGRNLLREEERFIEQLKSYGETVRPDSCVRIAVAQTPLRGQVADWASGWLIETVFPSRDRDAVLRPTSTCLSMLQKGEIDAAIVPGDGPIKGALLIKTIGVSLRVLVSRDCCWAKDREVRLEDLARTSLAYPYEDEVLLPLIRSRFDEEGLPVPDLIPVPILIEDTVGFVLEGGALLTGPNNELARRDNRLAEALLHPQQRLRVPVSLYVPEKRSHG